MATNDQVADNFIRQTGRAINGNTCYYSGNDFYSYSTLYAVLDTDKHVLLLSDNNMSSTSAKHRNSLITSASNHSVKVLPVPMQINNQDTPTMEVFKGRFEARMDSNVIGTNLALADNRKEFLINVARYKEFCEYANLTPNDKYIKLEEKITQDTDYIKELQRKRRSFLKKESSNYDEVLEEHYQNM